GLARLRLPPALARERELRQHREEREHEREEQEAGEDDRAPPKPPRVEVREAQAEEDRRDGDHDVRLQIRLRAERDELLVDVPEDVVHDVAAADVREGLGRLLGHPDEYPRAADALW